MYGFTNDSFGGAPPQQSDLSVFAAPELRRVDQRQNRFHLAQALFMHGLALVRIGIFVADQYAVFIVIVGGDDMFESRSPRDRAWRNARFSKLVTLVAAVERRQRAVQTDDRAALDRNIEIQLRRIDARAAFRKQQIR